MPEFFGRYELLELLGRGGMGEVYRAYDTERRREVALKLLPDSFVSDEQFTARFQRESLLAAQLSEPHIVPIHDFGEIDGRLYIDMRIVEGEDLGTLISSRGRLSPRIAVDVVRQVAAALDAAHERGLVHRDVKPSNIMLTAITPELRNPPFAYLVDFGIARATGENMTALTTTSSSTVGTLAYMAPERISGDPFDGRSDVYALACVLYEALTGRMPFQGDAVALMYAHMTRDVPRPSEAAPDVPSALDQVVARGMAKDPQQRYASAGALADAAAAAVETASGPLRTGPVTDGPPPARDPFGPVTTTTAARYTPPPTGVAGAPPTTARGPGYGPPPHQQPPPLNFGPPGPPPRRGWTPRRKAVAVGAVLVAAVAVGVPLAVSGGGGDTKGNGPAPGTSGASTRVGSSTGSPGGTLYYAFGDPVTTWDPQQIGRTRDVSIESRLFSRTLTQLGPDSVPDGAKLAPDLATDTGHASADGKTWTFTLRTGVRWQDGSAVTCADVAYGISRTFDLRINSGQDALAPRLVQIGKGGSTDGYDGPYFKDNQTLYDQAVSCSGQTITFHLQKPTYDFNYALTLPEFAAIKSSRDRGPTTPYTIFSDGPYMLQGTWDSSAGGTFVRNPQYDPRTDDDSIRKALPDTIVVTPNVPTDTTYQQLFADTGKGRDMVTGDLLTAASLPRAAALPERLSSTAEGFVNVLVPNFTRLKDLRVRQALAYATDRVGYVDAQGGTTVSSPVHGLVPPWVGRNGGYRSFTAFDVRDNGDAGIAQGMLQAAGIRTPVPLRFVVRSQAPTSVLAGARALVTSWNAAGFKVTLQALPDSSYGPLVENPANAGRWDLTILSWAPKYATASTVIPNVFDSRQNLSGAGNGADLGMFSNDPVNAAIDTALATADATSRNDQWGALDRKLALLVAYIPLDNPRFARLHGSNVTGYTESTAATGGFPDLGQIGVKG